jgi:hypothetical protein
MGCHVAHMERGDNVYQTATGKLEWSTWIILKLCFRKTGYEFVKWV